MRKFLLFLCLFTGQTFAAVNIGDKLFFDDTLEAAKERDYQSIKKEEKNHSSMANFGVYYAPNTKELFRVGNYTLPAGSMRKNLDAITKKEGWRLDWNMETDYDIPVAFSVKNQNLPDLFATICAHLPLKVMFFAKNKVVLVLPLYDKRESDIGHKYTNG